jgi:hypothetical protein
MIKPFAVGLLGSSVFIALMTVYARVMWWVGSNVWHLVGSLLPEVRH